MLFIAIPERYQVVNLTHVSRVQMTYNIKHAQRTRSSLISAGSKFQSQTSLTNKRTLKNLIYFRWLPEAYRKHCQTSKKSFFAKIVNGLKICSNFVCSWLVVYSSIVFTIPHENLLPSAVTIIIWTIRDSQIIVGQTQFFHFLYDAGTSHSYVKSYWKTKKWYQS